MGSKHVSAEEKLAVSKKLRPWLGTPEYAERLKRESAAIGRGVETVRHWVHRYAGEGEDVFLKPKKPRVLLERCPKLKTLVECQNRAGEPGVIEEVAQALGKAPSDIRSWQETLERNGINSFLGICAYSQSFKNEAVKRHLVEGQSVKKVADDLGTHSATVKNWVHAVQQTPDFFEADAEELEAMKLFQELGYTAQNTMGLIGKRAKALAEKGVAKQAEQSTFLFPEPEERVAQNVSVEETLEEDILNRLLGIMDDVKAAVVAGGNERFEALTERVRDLEREKLDLENKNRRLHAVNLDYATQVSELVEGA